MIRLLAGMLAVVWFGCDQHFGGLEQTRREYEELLQRLPPELRAQNDTPAFRQKIASNRIFATFVYPNALEPSPRTFIWSSVCERNAGRMCE